MRHHLPTANKPITIAIANDTAMAVEALSRVIHSTPHYRLLWIAQTGTEAVQYCSAQRPDVILMDLNMPGISGVEATRQIMQHTPCAILIVTASVSSNTGKVFEAMGHGALDAVTTPAIGTGDKAAIEILLQKIAVVARFSHSALPTRPSTGAKNKRTASVSPYPGQYAAPHKRVPYPVSPPLNSPPLIVIGTSTGGPNALRQILSQLPAPDESTPFNASIIVIQHLDAQFSTVFVDWLNQFSEIPVRAAQNGDRPEAGKVLIAGINEHLIMRPNQTLRYKHEPSRYNHRPSVDIFFQSVAQHWPQPGIALLLTGMGHDGAEGMAHLHAAKWHTLAESAESCAVFGMPKSAIDRGVVNRTLPLEKIAANLIQATNYPGFSA